VRFLIRGGEELPKILNPKQDLSRVQYVLWGMGLFFLKANLDRVIASQMGHTDWRDNWTEIIGNYYFLGDHHGSVMAILTDAGSRNFHILLLLHALPFMVAGILLTLRRLHTLNFHPWLVILFFVPYVQLVFYCLLAILPPDRLGDEVKNKGDLLGDYLPVNKWSAAIVAAGLTTVFGLLAVLLAVIGLGEYSGFFCLSDYPSVWAWSPLCCTKLKCGDLLAKALVWQLPVFCLWRS